RGLSAASANSRKKKRSRESTVAFTTAGPMAWANWSANRSAKRSSARLGRRAEGAGERQRHTDLAKHHLCVHENITDGQREPAVRHCASRALLIQHLDVAEMARGVARPPDPVRVGWIDVDPSRIRLHDRQRELSPRFRLRIEAGDLVRSL